MGWPKGKPRPPSFRAARKKALADPEVRARMSAARKKALADPEVRARMSAASKKAWADPEVRARMSAARRGRRERSCFHCGYRGHPNALAPIDGLPGEFECKVEKACERRILSRENGATSLKITATQMAAAV